MDPNRPFNPNGYRQTEKHLKGVEMAARFDPDVTGNFTFWEGKITHANGIPLEEYSKEELIGIMKATSFFILVGKRLPLDLTDNVRYVPFKDNRRIRDRNNRNNRTIT